MNREDFRKLAETRLEDAKALLLAGRFDAAYYLAGYAVECMLKACICRNTREFDFPPGNATDYRTHDLDRLVSLAKLKPARDALIESDERFAAYWLLVKDWKVERRYRYEGSEGARAARALIHAISDPDHGVLQWLSKLDGKI